MLSSRVLEVDEGAFPEIVGQVGPRAVCLGNLFRDQLDRYGELELIAERWRATVAGLLGSMRGSSSTPMTRCSPVLARARQGSIVHFGLDDASSREGAPAARSRLEVLRRLRLALSSTTPPT